jgi:hypothetical protein
MRKLVLFPMLFLVGCARLITQVSIFDTQCMVDQVALESSLNRAIGNISTYEARNQYAEVEKELIPKIIRLVTDLNAKHYIANEDKQRTIETLENVYSGELHSAHEKHRQAVHDFLEAKQLTDSNKRLMKLLEVQANVLHGDKIIREVAVELEQQLALTSSELLRNAGEDSLVKSLEAAKKEVKSMSSGSDYSKLVHDPIAALVVNADKKCWEGVYNETWGSGSWGNTDIAIKMESAVEYTLKGLRLDSAKVTQAVFKTLGQAIQLTAAAYGVPVSGKSATPQEGVAIDDDVVQADQKKLDADSSRRVSRRSALALMEVIVSQDEALKDAGKWKEAVTHIKKSFETYKPTLLIPE